MQKKISFETESGIVDGWISINYNNETMIVSGHCPSRHEPTNRTVKCSSLRCFVDNKVVIEQKEIVCNDTEFMRKIDAIEKEFVDYLRKTYEKKENKVVDYLKGKGYE